MNTRRQGRCVFRRGWVGSVDVLVTVALVGGFEGGGGDEVAGFIWRGWEG